MAGRRGKWRKEWGIGCGREGDRHDELRAKSAYRALHDQWVISEWRGQPEQRESSGDAAMEGCETQGASRLAAAAALISADSQIGRTDRAVNFKKGVHGAMVFARSDALLASICSVSVASAECLFRQPAHSAETRRHVINIAQHIRWVGVWSLFKRSLVRSLHQVSARHLDSYLEGVEWLQPARLLSTPMMEFRELIELRGRPDFLKSVYKQHVRPFLIPPDR